MKKIIILIFMMSLVSSCVETDIAKDLRDLPFSQNYDNYGYTVTINVPSRAYTAAYYYFWSPSGGVTEFATSGLWPSDDYAFDIKMEGMCVTSFRIDSTMALSSTDQFNIYRNQNTNDIIANIAPTNGETTAEATIINNPNLHLGDKIYIQGYFITGGTSTITASFQVRACD